MDVSRLRITADKREIRDFLKLPLTTSFIRKTFIGDWFNQNL
jgi:hypothetical protein